MLCFRKYPYLLYKNVMAESSAVFYRKVRHALSIRYLTAHTGGHHEHPQGDWTISFMLTEQMKVLSRLELGYYMKKSILQGLLP